MAAPNLEDPLDEAIADHWRKNQAGALKTAREWTINYANQWDIIEVVNIRADKWQSGNEHLTKGHFLLSIVYKLSYVFLVIISVKFIHFFEILLLFDSWDCWARIQYYYSKFDRLNLRNLRRKKNTVKNFIWIIESQALICHSPVRLCSAFPQSDWLLRMILFIHTLNTALVFFPALYHKRQWPTSFLICRHWQYKISDS